MAEATFTRWTARRKLAVLGEVKAGILSREEALSRYGLTDAELASWESMYDAHGIVGLSATKIQAFRRER